MKTLVIGGAGFIGSHVADLLATKDHEITIFDRMESPYLKEGFHTIVGDINDPKALEDAVKGKDYVLNFAGIAGLNDAKEHPIDAATINILGNLNVLEALRKHPPRRYVFASTFYVYSTSGSIYRITKQSSEMFVEEYSKQYGINFSILRYGSVYGTRAGYANAIYRFLREAVEFGSITRKGSGSDQREYISVIDAATSTYQIMVDPECENKHYILAGQQKFKVDDLFHMINEMMGGRLSITYQPGDLNTHGHYSITPYSFKPAQATRYTLNCYHDLGQGMLEMMHEIHDQLNQEKEKSE